MPPARRLLAASAALAERDPVMAGLVDRIGPCTLARRSSGADPFMGLARAIVFQQLAGRAATAIFDRVLVAAGGQLTPESVLAVPPEALRAAGLSGAKTASVLDLAARVASGSLNLAGLRRRADDEVVAALTQVRGIGRWTAEMFLIFDLGRLDVWPVSDLGVRKGYALAYGLAALPTPAELTMLGERFAPFRSLAAWYCWRAVDTVVPV